MPAVKYNVYFALGLTTSEAFKLPAIVFSPSSDSWNDFSLRTLFVFRVLEEPERTRDTGTGDVHLGFVDSDESPADRISALLRQKPDFYLPAKELPQFYTMQLGMQAYRDLVRKRGIDRSRDLLLAMNDLIAWKDVKEPKWYRAAVSSDTFGLSFVRESGCADFAFHNAGSILSGLEQEGLSGLSNRLRLSFKLPSFQNDHELDFAFEHEGDLPRRIAILIGKNGIGKSQALSNFAKSLLNNDSRLRTDDGLRPSIYCLVAVSSPGETRTTFPSPRNTDRLRYKRIFLGRAQFGGQSRFGEILVQLARSQDSIE